MTVRVFWFFCGLVCLSAPCSSYAKILTEKDLEALQQGKIKNISELSLDFTQSIFRSLRKKTSLTYGVVYFKKPNQFHWMLTKPKISQWLFDGVSLVHHEAGEMAASRYPGGSSKAQELGQVVDMVLNFNRLMQNYNIASAKEEHSSIFMELLPKVSQSELEKAFLEYDQKTEYIKKIQLFFKGNNHTTFEFSNPKPLTVTSDFKPFVLPTSLKIVDVL
jgi:outer membrane lipoprotein-sorting protein